MSSIAVDKASTKMITEIPVALPVTLPVLNFWRISNLIGLKLILLDNPVYYSESSNEVKNCCHSFPLNITKESLP
jgi:hypothetical protein